MAQVLDRIKLFLDTNVLLDILVKREGTVYAAAILEAARRSQVELVTTTQSFLDAAYIMRSAAHREKYNKFLSWMLNNTNVEYLDTFDLKEGADSGGADLEDEAQVAHAISSACDYFITSDKELLKKDIPGMAFVTPKDLVDRMKAAGASEREAPAALVKSDV